MLFKTLGLHFNIYIFNNSNNPLFTLYTNTPNTVTSPALVYRRMWLYSETCRLPMTLPIRTQLLCDYNHRPNNRVRFAPDELISCWRICSPNASLFTRFLVIFYVWECLFDMLELYFFFCIVDCISGVVALHVTSQKTYVENRSKWMSLFCCGLKMTINSVF